MWWSSVDTPNLLRCNEKTDRCRTPGPTPGVDLWWSGKHDNHGGNVSLCPWNIGRITAAALVILHIDHNRTT